MRKRLIPVIVILLLLIPGYFIFEATHPRTAGRFPFMVFLLAVDIYLWVSLRSKFKALKSPARFTVTLLYWMPLAAFIFFTIISAVRNVHLSHPALVSYILGVTIIAYFAKLLSVLFFLLADVFRITAFVYRHARAKKTGRPVSQDPATMTRGRFLRTLGLASGGVLFSGMLIGMVKWAHDFRVRHVGLHFPALPFSFEGFRIVQISDLHLGSWASTGPIEEAASIIRDLDPDVVMFTGDLVNYSTDEAFRFRQALAGIQARYGVYAILGNHDYGDYVNWPTAREKEENMESLYRFYEEIGWTLLRNESRDIVIDEERIAVMGVENWSANTRFPQLGDMQAASVNSAQAPVKILLSHDPSHWEKVVRDGHPEIDLTLSGHTHGFQFGVELKNFKWSFAQYLYKYWAGLYETPAGEKPRFLYVNRGLGMIGYPGRVGILPEITLITLES